MWNPISGTAIQYMRTAGGVAASDYFLKFYAAGTTTPIDMATDSTGDTLLAKARLNNEGYVRTEASEESVFVPHIDQAYKLVLYSTETAADADDPSGVVWDVDNLEVSDTGTDQIVRQEERRHFGSELGNVLNLVDITLTPGLEGGSQVYINGVSQKSGIDYQINTPTQLEFTGTIPFSGDAIDVYSSVVTTSISEGEIISTQKIVEAAAPYTIDGTEDVVRISNNGLVTFPPVSLATKAVNLYADGGDVTPVFSGTETTNQAIVTSGNAAYYCPFKLKNAWDVI